jgi:integrase
MLAIARSCKCRRARAAIRIAFYSGMRLSEILGAERLDGMFVLADTKNGEPRHVPMHPRIRAAAQVGPRNKWNVSKEFKAAAVAIGMGHLRFHDLRHSAASEMINAKVDLYTVGAVLGHKSAASTKRYAHLATDAIKTALGQIGKKSPTQKKTRAA